MKLIEKIEDYLNEAPDENIVKVKGDVLKDKEVLFKDTIFSFAFNKTKSGDIKGLTIYPEKHDAFNVVKGRGARVDYSKKDLVGFMTKMTKYPVLSIEVIHLPSNPINIEKGIAGTYTFSFKSSNLKEVQDFYSSK